MGARPDGYARRERRTAALPSARAAKQAPTRTPSRSHTAILSAPAKPPGTWRAVRTRARTASR